MRAGAIGIVVAAVGAMGASALAASPQRSAHYSGTGTLYTNNAPKWVKDPGKQPISFTTSANGRKILSFKGAFSYYCGGGTADVTAHTISVSGQGAFSYRFFVPKPEAYVAISGAFLRGGRASVSYLVDYVSPGQHIAHPYSTSNPRALGCASWVRGTVKVG